MRVEILQAGQDGRLWKTSPLLCRGCWLRWPWPCRAGVWPLPWPRAAGPGCPLSASQGQRGWASVVGWFPPACSSFLTVSTSRGCSDNDHSGVPGWKLLSRTLEPGVQNPAQQGPAPPEPAGRLLAASGAATVFRALGPTPASACTWSVSVPRPLLIRAPVTLGEEPSLLPGDLL